MHQFKLRCPNCKNTQLYQTKTILLENKRRVCVYCGKSFKVKENING